MGADRVIGHKEWAGKSQGKWDPGAIDMNIFRADIQARLSTPAPVGDDELSAEAERLIVEMRNEIRELRAEWGPDKRGPSRSFMAENGQPIESPLGFLYNIDGNAWSMTLTFAYLFHVPKAIEVVETIARDGVYKGSWAQAEGFNAWLREFGQAYCQGLVEFKAALVAKLAPSAQRTTTGAVDPTALSVPAVLPQPSAREIAGQLATMLPTPVPDTTALQQAYEENARLREENARLLAEGSVSTALVASETITDNNPTLGQTVGEFVDAVDKLRLADSSDIQERATLAASIKVLSTKNGTDL